MRACADYFCASPPTVPQVAKFSAFRFMMSSHLGDEISPGRPPDECYAESYHSVVDLHRWFRSWIRRVRMAIASTRSAVLDLRITRSPTAHLDLWARSPGILSLPPGASDRVRDRHFSAQITP